MLIQCNRGVPTAVRKLFLCLCAKGCTVFVVQNARVGFLCCFGFFLFLFDWLVFVVATKEICRGIDDQIKNLLKVPDVWNLQLKGFTDTLHRQLE